MRTGIIAFLAGILAVTFVNEVSGVEERLLAPSNKLRADKIECGVWFPLRMQPSTSPLAANQSAYLSPYNAKTANRIIAGLNKPKSIIFIKGEFGRVIVGCEDGLVHGMRPRILSKMFQGAYLRESASDWNLKGKLVIVSQNSEKVVMEWNGESSRRAITVFSNGIIETHWHDGPTSLGIFTGCFPYSYMSESAGKEVRFSQLVPKHRTLSFLLTEMVMVKHFSTSSLVPEGLSLMPGKFLRNPERLHCPHRKTRNFGRLFQKFK